MIRVVTLHFCAGTKRYGLVGERLDLGAEGAGSNPGSDYDWKMLSVNPAVNGYFFSNQGRIKRQRERDGLRLEYAVSKIQ